jgi:hypothetical protein
LEGSVEREITVDLEAILQSGDCSKDIWLEWGDVIEIPEKDHKINERWAGFPKKLLEALPKCLARTVSISVKGEATPILLAPKLRNVVSTTDEDLWVVWGLDYSLNDVISLSGLLRTSSDKTRVKVTRINPVTQKSEEQVFNLENPDSQNQLWLRDGDRIEIPEKP